MTEPGIGAERASRIIRLGIAAVWISTGVLVVHPFYRAEGMHYLGQLGLPLWLMVVTCAAEIALGLRVALGPATRSVTLLQVGAVAFFTAVLAVLDPWLLVHPFGVLSKNYPLIALLGVCFLLERDGWSPAADRLLRVGVALVWITEGILPKMVFQQSMELSIVSNSGLVPFDPGLFLFLLGAVQAGSGAVALIAKGRLLRVVLLCQLVGLTVLPVLVSIQLPAMWVHPFGPFTKNLPIIAGTFVMVRRCS